MEIYWETIRFSIIFSLNFTSLSFGGIFTQSTQLTKLFFIFCCWHSVCICLRFIWKLVCIKDHHLFGTCWIHHVNIVEVVHSGLSYIQLVVKTNYSSIISIKWYVQAPSVRENGQHLYLLLYLYSLKIHEKSYWATPILHRTFCKKKQIFFNTFSLSLHSFTLYFPSLPPP